METTVALTLALMMFSQTTPDYKITHRLNTRGPGATSYRADLAATIDKQVNSHLQQWLAYYRDLHTHPELSLHETESARKIAKQFTADGYEVTTGVGGTGVVAVLANGPGPTVLVRTDLDALPVVEETGLAYSSQVKVTGSDGRPVGVMHACGHDVHQTSLIGTAYILAQTREQWSGTLVIIAQPAEEVGKGARMMIKDGLFDRFPRPDFCMGMHVSASLPAGTIGYTAGWALANVDSVDVTIYGRGGHGSRPHETIDPVVTAAYVIVALQTIVSRRVDPIEPAVITVGSVHAGSKHNIISNEAKLQITVRSYTDQTRKVLLDGIREVTINTCRAMGCQRDPDVTVRDDEFTPATYNDPVLVDEAVNVMRKVVGAEHVVSVKARMGGEDFGRYSRQLGVPGFMFWLGGVNVEKFKASQQPDGPRLPPLHSSKFAPDPEPTIATGVRCMSSVVLSLLRAKE